MLHGPKTVKPPARNPAWLGSMFYVYALTGLGCFFGVFLQASLPEHVVIESKPDSQVDDLR